MSFHWFNFSSNLNGPDTERSISDCTTGTQPDYRATIVLAHQLFHFQLIHAVLQWRRAINRMQLGSTHFQWQSQKDFHWSPEELLKIFLSRNCQGQHARLQLSHPKKSLQVFTHTQTSENKYSFEKQNCSLLAILWPWLCHRTISGDKEELSFPPGKK